MADQPNPDDPRSPGWEAITAACAKLYPAQQPRHWGPIQRFAMGGPDPLDGISVYLHEIGAGLPHWHYVSYGMSELYKKELPNKETSGWGIEFTFRLKRAPMETQPPQWPLHLMQNLARYVFQTSNVLGPGHYMHLNGPIATDHETALHATMFLEDPELASIQTPNGRVRFLLIIGATVDELAAARAWNAEKLLAVMRQRYPLLVTDLSRLSMLDDQKTADFVAAETARDGSTTDVLRVPSLTVDADGENSLTLTLGANCIVDLQSLFRGRTGHGRPLQVSSPDYSVEFHPAETFAFKKLDENKTRIDLPAPSANILAQTLHPRRGEYQVPQLSGFTLRVVPSEIKDHTGKNVVKIVG